MCGRFALWTLVRALMEEFGLEEANFEPEPRYNIAPTQRVAAVVREGGRDRLVGMRWGFVAPWAKEASGIAPINARAETVAEKPTFRAAFRQHRCLLPADAFYEWRKVGDRKVPMLVRMGSRKPFGLAGIYGTWRGPDGTEVVSCAIVTTSANELMASIHDRMPFIVPRDARAIWLDPEVRDPARLQPLMRPYPSSEMEAYQVSREVNSPSHDHPGLAKSVRGPF
jgi:putative SOS response-associated peptidase YedK